MNTKRLILMLLVALMNITGAWAETETETLVEVSDGILKVGVGYFAYYPSKLIEILYEDEYCKVYRTKVDLSEEWFRYTYVIECKQGFEIRGNVYILLGSSYGVQNPYRNFIAKADGVAMQHWLDYGQNGMYVSVQSASKLEINGESNVYSADWAVSLLKFDMYMPQHEHVYSAEWTQTATHHYHVCTKYPSPASSVDEKTYQHVPYVCRAKSYEGEHIYSTNPADGALNYTCSVCGYVDEARKAQYLDRDYLSLTATGGDMTIGMQKTGSPNDYVIRYSADKMQWTTQTLSATTDIVTIPAGKTYYFAHGTDEVLSHISNNQNNCWSFTMTGSGTVQAGGNIVSLLDVTCQKNTLAGSPQHVFTGLFKGCEKLTKAPELPFMSLSQFCYMYMFEGTGISVAPELPATTIPDGAYMGMFKDCKNLETVPLLPATTVQRRGYQEMFYGCEKLKTVEIANITTVSSSQDGVFTDWLSGAAADGDGKLIASLDGLCNAKIPAECIPSNWQWATKLKANQDPDSYDASFYTTFYDSRYAYTLSEGVKAYTATIAEEDGDKVVKLTAIEGDILPKDVAVLLHSNTTGEMLMTISEENGNEPAMNLFSGVDVETEQFNHPNYMLSYGQEGLGFYMMNPAMKLSANKAFLPAADPAMANARAFRMVFEDEETGIENINDDDTLRYDNDNIYSVSGIRLNKLQKGINIVNGKKVVIK